MGDIEVAVSTVIFALRPDRCARGTALWLPLVRRIKEPYAGRWALPGGPVRRDEDVEQAARRTLLETTALAPKYLEQLYTFGQVERAAEPVPGPRVISVVYWALVRPEEAEHGIEDENVGWHLADAPPGLAFDHATIVRYALWRLRTKMEYSRVAQAFLGDTFTLAQLREVYEVVLERTLDPANFRRQMESSGAVEPTGDYLVGGRHRPPRLYRHRETRDLADNGPLTRRQDVVGSRPTSTNPTPTNPTSGSRQTP
ncbi:8-oxo-dGTP diphosphatase [Mumia flava]|uniref:8-oxo-dGTP diphosphatase n=1 Tax=Mumia flava TaxID=1348852 RepID=A0A2M9AR54_9ACTN|nr:NUDIX domain-containing protein [Mumia flava]PJJ48185.1 8-oxo-dGTP diphosphatase [Mumia flava]